jgi:hypothetical protein
MVLCNEVQEIWSITQHSSSGYGPEIGSESISSVRHDENTSLHLLFDQVEEASFSVPEMRGREYADFLSIPKLL